MLEINCPNCGKAYRISEEHHGRAFRCNACQQEFTASSHANSSVIETIEPSLGKTKRAADEIDYEIFGEDIQFAEILLDPGETVISEAGSMMYMTFASIAIAQANGIELDLGTQLTMLLVLMLTSKGIAGVPRASLVVVTATCAMFKIPPEGIALILPIDHFCDMFRSATNVVGNALATTVVSKWEGELAPGEATA